ncbi:hypothetical protein DFH06DRAFT_1173112 [Mycena polygramma]|nr:hypothetical protein DFH06DRAFT_1173112 [Mycena polygramma]
MSSSHHDRSAFTSPHLPPQHMEELRRLLRTNSPHPDTESGAHFRFIIASSAPDLARYDEAIHAIQETLTRLILERKALQDYSDGCCSLFAPVRRLPPEILAEIFALCRPVQLRIFDPSEDYPEDAAERVSQSHLLPLSQVCCSWRETVIGTPKLWGTIETVLLSNHDEEIGSLSRSIQRSASCPLTIHFAATTASGAKAGFDLLAPHSFRWHSLDIFVHTALLTVLGSVEGQLPVLQRLEIGGSTHLLHDIFTVAPELTHVTLAPDAHSEPPSLPWNQLREVIYEAGNCTGDLPFAILRHCPRQCAFVIRNLQVTYLRVPMPALPPIVFNIQSLQWEMGDFEDDEHSQQSLGGLLGRLTLPCLRELTLQSCDGAPPLFWPQGDFLAFTSRSLFRENLIKLCLQDVIITTDELVECLSQMQAIQELFIQDVPARAHILITDGLFHSLTRTSGPACLIPHLSSFRFACGLHFSETMLLGFVESRLFPGQRPLEITIEWQGGVSMKDSAVVRLAELANYREVCRSWIQ